MDRNETYRENIDDHGDEGEDGLIEKTLYERFVQVVELVENYDPSSDYETGLIGFSVPEELLHEYSSLYCLECHFCHSCDDREFAPVLGWTSRNTYMMNKEKCSYGKEIIIFPNSLELYDSPNMISLK